MEQSRFEFLVISGDIAAYKTLSAAIQRMNGSVSYTSTTANARAYISRRKIDGIFLDMSLEGSLELIQAIRQGTSNRYTVIFACLKPTDDAAKLLGAGVNFVLYKPLQPDAVVSTLDTATPMIHAERKRYVRHQVTVPVVIKLHDHEQKAITSNVSRGGMAVRCQNTYERGAAIQFQFAVPEGEIKGQGEVAWSNTEGFMGIKFFLLGDKDKKSLMGWLDQRETGGMAMQ